ncbi:MAG TPA: hypothetical protein VFP50_02020, partial [Anaeromyxobacteraceae bacterium]|nr:hypothetical protein [Anaeromyxobacteraceae bacterium]
MTVLLLALALAAPASTPGAPDLTPALSGPPAGAGALLEAGKAAEALAALGGASRPEDRATARARRPR